MKTTDPTQADSNAVSISLMMLLSFKWRFVWQAMAVRTGLDHNFMIADPAMYLHPLDRKVKLPRPIAKSMMISSQQTFPSQMPDIIVGR